MVKNKRGWIKVVEAFLAIMLLMGLVFLIVGNEPLRKNVDSVIEKQQMEILREIEFNQTLRGEVLGIVTPPLDSTEDDFPSELKNFMEEKVSNPNCLLKICEISTTCELGSEVVGEVYSNYIFISSNSTTYNPRRVKMICYEED